MYQITTPIPYVNSTPHLGTVLEPVFNDCIARFRRRLGEKVLFTTGADQHGLKIYNESQKQNLNPQEYADNITKDFIELYDKLEISYDVFTPTTSEKHRKVAQIIWAKLASKDLIYKKKYTGLYCVGCEDFYAPSQLTEEGNCPIHLTKPIEMTEENYFFKLSSFQDVVTEFLKSDVIEPRSISKEWLNFIEDGLQDISISREQKRLPWGVPVPNDETQVMYVWFEALINYITATIHDDIIERLFEEPELEAEILQEVWDEVEAAFPINFMYTGTDISKFHSIIWIAMLDALDLPLPKKYLAHGMINDKDGIKFSKSLGNGVYPDEIMDKLNGVEGLRFVLLHEVNAIGDSNFDWDRTIDSYNANLADNLGNLLIRVTTLAEKHLDIVAEDPAEFSVSLDKTYQALDEFNPAQAFKALLAESTTINQYLETSQPWKLVKDEANKEQVRRILSDCVIALRTIGEALSIFLPESGARIVEACTADPIVKAEVLFPKVEK